MRDTRLGMRRVCGIAQRRRQPGHLWSKHKEV